MTTTRRSAGSGFTHGRTPVMTRDEEREVVERLLACDPEARDHLIRANLGIVVKIAQGFKGRGLPLDDLIGEGNLGLIRATETFDPKFGVRFASYAMWWIRQAIGRSLGKRRMIRLPESFDNEVFPRWYRMADELANRLGRPPTDDEVGKALGISDRRLATIKQALFVNRPMSEIKPWNAACSPASV